MKELPQVTVVIVDTVNYGKAVNAIQKTLEQIKPSRVMFFTDVQMELPGVEIVHIPHLYSKKEYSDWMMKKLGEQFIDTSHILIIQHDGYVLDGEQWTDQFLNYDYIGAPWLERDGFNVGNGGFSLRSTDLHIKMAIDDTIIGIQPEDVGICRIYRNYLEQKYEIKFAPEELAHKFSFELHQPKDKTFGFHAYFHRPYVEPIVIKRTGAMGDVIQTEPVLEYFYRKGHPVYLDTLPSFYELFGRHYFPIGDYSKFDKVIKHRVINLDLAYETNPAQLHLKSYFHAAGVQDYELRNPRLNWPVQDENRLFKKDYVVLHIDKRETTHRNIHGVDWTRVVNNLQDRGFTVITVGKGEHDDVGIYFNAVNQVMLMWAIAGCELFIGIDSGPAQIAVATGRKTLIFFGSVNPNFIHADMEKVEVLQSPCPFGTPNCWHLTPSTTGQECQQPDQPPCTVHYTRSVIQAIDKALKR